MALTDCDQATDDASSCASARTGEMSLIGDTGVNGFGGSFSPANAPYGGFGGGSCVARKVPVVFVHGNGDEAKNWDYPSFNQSVYQRFRGNGYTACELFGINYLSKAENESPQYNYHSSARAKIVSDFIGDVLKYTASSKVDIIAHSMGATVSMHALDKALLWGKVRKFIGISSSYKGLQSCLWLGPANYVATTCGSQNYFNSNVFGFYPDGSFWYPNPRMGSGSRAFRRRAAQYPGVTFYSIGAGKYDQIACTAATEYAYGCDQSWKLDTSPNLRAQLHMGFGKTASQLDYDFTDWSIYNVDGGDSGAATGTGLGHFAAKVSTSQVQFNMISTDCAGTSCCAGYSNPCVDERE